MILVAVLFQRIRTSKHNFIVSTCLFLFSVLFVSDVKVTFEEFRQKMVATCTSKTIIVANPDTGEAHHLFNYAQSMGAFVDPSVDGINGDIDLTSIQDVYNLNQVEDKLLETSGMSLMSTPFYGIIYAYISAFDIDGKDKCVVTRCTSCKRRTDFNSSANDTAMCTNSLCVGNQTTSKSFEIRVSLSDCTHGLDGFMMSKELAEETLGCDVETFLRFTEKEKTDLKWRFLLERYKIFFKGVPAGQNRSKSFLSILSIDQIDVNEILQNEG